MGHAMFLQKGRIHTVPSTLPSDYTALEYIQSTGTQYIDTGVPGDWDVRVDIAFDLMEVSSATACIFGAQKNNDNRYVLCTTSSGTFRSDYGSEYIAGAAAAVGTHYLADKNRNNCKINDGAIACAQATFSGNSNIYLCARSYTTLSQSKIKLYKCRIFKNDVPVRDFVPCRNASGVTGLWDNIGKQFYANAGTGQFRDNLIETVAITADNIGTYFTVTDGTYKFAGSGSVFTSNNGGVKNSTASTVLTAKQDIMELSFDYSYSSEQKYDKFTLKVGGTTVENAVSGATTSKSYSGSLTSGQAIEFSYVKDSSQDKNDDQCTFSNMSITIAKGAA